MDTGGTFTDLVLEDEDGLRVEKVLSTPAAPEAAVLEGVERLAPGPEVEVVHGSTVGLNALLTGRGARVALVTNAGFRDLIEIARQDRPDLYALHPVRPAPLAAREDRHEVQARAFPGEGGAVQVVILVRLQRPQEGRKAQRPKAQRRADQDNQDIHLSRNALRVTSNEGS